MKEDYETLFNKLKGKKYFIKFDGELREYSIGNESNPSKCFSVNFSNIFESLQNLIEKVQGQIDASSSEVHSEMSRTLSKALYLIDLEHHFLRDPLTGHENPDCDMSRWIASIEDSFGALRERSNPVLETSSSNNILQSLITRTLLNNTSLRYSITDLIQQIYILWKEEIILACSQLSSFPDRIVASSQFRFKQSYFNHHFPWYNSLLLIIGEITALSQLAQDQENTWNQQAKSHHEDRVNYLLPISFQKLWQYQNNLEDWRQYLRENIPELSEIVLQKKIDLHHHLEEMIIPYVTSILQHTQLRDKNGLRTQDLLPFSTLLDRLSSSITGTSTNTVSCILDQYGILLSVEIKSKKLKIDLPGGKREITETSLECSLRETYEEIGFAFQEFVETIHYVPSRYQKEFQFGEKFDLLSMSCFPFYHRSIYEYCFE